MDIIVPSAIRGKELGGQISDEARKLFAKLKEKPELAIGISSPGLPPKIVASQSLRDDRRRRAPAPVNPTTCLRTSRNGVANPIGYTKAGLGMRAGGEREAFFL